MSAAALLQTPQKNSLPHPRVASLWADQTSLAVHGIPATPRYLFARCMKICGRPDTNYVGYSHATGPQVGLQSKMCLLLGWREVQKLS